MNIVNDRISIIFARIQPDKHWHVRQWCPTRGDAEKVVAQLQKQYPRTDYKIDDVERDPEAVWQRERISA